MTNFSNTVVENLYLARNEISILYLTIFMAIFANFGGLGSISDSKYGDYSCDVLSYSQCSFPT